MEDRWLKKKYLKSQNLKKLKVYKTCKKPLC